MKSTTIRPTQVAQSHLARDLVGRFEVGACRGFLDVAAARRARRVHVDRHQRLGVIDDDRAARRQRYRARERGLDLVLDLEAREQRRVVAITLHAMRRLGHHVRHELQRLVVDVVGVDQDLADVGREVVADRADHERAFLIDQERALAGLCGAVDRAPQLEHVVQVPLQLGCAAPDAGGARDQAHAFGVVELVEVFLQLLAVFALDAARHAAAARIVRHQHQVAPGQGDEGRQRSALVAALLLFDLHEQRVAFLDRVLDARRAHVDTFAEEIARDLLERQEAVPVFTVVDKTGFERRLDSRHDGFVDIAFALFATFDLGFEVEQFLAVDDGQTPLFGLRRVDQHAFHRCSSRHCFSGAKHHVTPASRNDLRCTRETRRNRKGIALDRGFDRLRRPASRRWRVRGGEVRGTSGPPLPCGRGWRGRRPRAARARAGRQPAGQASAMKAAGGGPGTTSE